MRIYLSGRNEEARGEAAEILKEFPEFLLDIFFNGLPFRDKNSWIKDLHKVGLK